MSQPLAILVLIWIKSPQELKVETIWIFIILSSAMTKFLDYIISRGLLVSISEAIERIMLAYKEISELEGYTERVATMLNVFEDISNSKYQKSRITQKDGGPIPTNVVNVN